MKLHVALIILPAILLLNGSCRKKHRCVPLSDSVYTGRVVMDVCGNITVQVIDGSSLGQMGWVVPNDPNNTVYNNVFKVANNCTWGKTKSSDTIKFRITTPGLQDCVQCLAYAPTPDTAYSIKVLE